MKYFCCVFICLICCFNLLAQTLERQVIGSSGHFSTAGWCSLSSTTGEAMIIKLSSSSNILTQGFQQPQTFGVGINEYSIGNGEIQIFPNPAIDKINIQIRCLLPNNNQLITFFDLLGQKIKLPFESAYTGNQAFFIYDLKTLPPATYFISITNDNSKSKNTFKFTKVI